MFFQKEPGGGDVGSRSIFAFPLPTRQKRIMQERPGDPLPRARVLTDRERAEAAILREIAQKAPPPLFPSEPPWSACAAELAHLWLRVRCDCGAASAIPLRYLAAMREWQAPLSAIIPRLRCRKCQQQPTSVDLVEDATLGGGVPKSGSKNSVRLV
jgi:hypothetical protein